MSIVFLMQNVPYGGKRRIGVSVGFEIGVKADALRTLYGCGFYLTAHHGMPIMVVVDRPETGWAMGEEIGEGETITELTETVIKSAFEDIMAGRSTNKSG